MRYVLCLSLLFLVAPLAKSEEPTDRAVGLRCEYAVDPLGVDTPTPRLMWRMESDRRGARQTAYEVIATSPEANGEGSEPVWTSGKVASSDPFVDMAPKRPFRCSQQVEWKVRLWDEAGKPTAWSEPAQFTTGVLTPVEWRAEWIVAPWQTESVLMRKDFTIRPGLRRAVAHVCGLGHFEMSLNGKKSGDGLLAPGWTRYNRTALYETHDITPLVAEGQNAVGLVLGDGMHHSERRNRFSKFQGTFGPQRAIVQVDLQYIDGTTEQVVTDESWRVDPGPVTYNDVFGGEDYDARRLPAGWDTAGFDDSAWPQAVELVRPSGELRGLTASAPPIGAIESFPAKVVGRDSPTRAVLDFGQNASFMPRLRVRGPAGSTVRLTHAEVLDESGQIDRSTCGGNRGPAYWQYTKATGDEETWFPKFFYAGCRYLQADLIPAQQGQAPVGQGGLPEIVLVEGVVVHTTAAPSGQFACSNELLNRIRTLVRWAQRSNLVSVLTDCPHREKLGWLEQYHLNGPGVRYEFDAHRLFLKGMRDMADAQLASGFVPNIAPEYVEFEGAFRAAAEWGSAVVLVPWQHYEATGDQRALAEHYAVMQRYLDYLGTRTKDGLLDEGLGDWYDLGPADRPGFAQLTLPPVTATAFYNLDAHVMHRIALALGKADDAAKYAELAESIRASWRRAFRNDDGTYASGSQAAHAIALVMGLAEERDRQTVLDALVKDVRDRGNAMTAGDVGFRYLLQALAAGGHGDVVYDMINQSEKPGYGYQLARGATSLTEAWDANHHASHNHFMLGHITEWFYKDLVGIASDPEGPGYEKIVIRPQPVGDLQWAEATHDTVRGPVEVRWERDGESLEVVVTIPANTTAKVYLPHSEGQKVSESGDPLAQAEGARLVGKELDTAIVEVVSGTYRFRME